MKRLVETNTNVALDAGGQMHLSFEIELDTKEEVGVLLLAVVIGGTLDQLAYKIYLVIKVLELD